MLYSNGAGLASTYRVNCEGNSQITLSGRLVPVSAFTISSVGGKVTTSLTKKGDALCSHPRCDQSRRGGPRDASARPPIERARMVATVNRD
jgi:hypothetical protein